MVEAIAVIVSPLFVPANQPERFAKAARSGADAVILDLEDGVAPEHKDRARQAIQSHGIEKTPVIVRINAASSPFLAADLAALIGVQLSAVMLAKAEMPEDLARLAAILPSGIPVMPLIETALGLRNLQAMLDAPNVCRVAFGAFDFSHDVGSRPSWEALLVARSELVWRSRAAGRAQPLDSPSAVLDDMIPVHDEAFRAAGLGFGGKLAIHPRQIEPIQRAFLPDVTSVAWAQTVVAASGDAGVARIDGQMVDKPILKRARRILAQLESRNTSGKHLA